MRYQSIDIARALAVIGVVLSHAVDGLLNAGISNSDGWLVATNQALYLVRMPALAFVLGLFALGGIDKRGRGGYVRVRATFALYLYLLWFVLQTSVEVMTSSLKNHPTPATALLEPWFPPAQLWFLPYLAVSSLVCSLLAPQLARRPWLVIAPFAVLSVAVWQWNPNIVGLRGLSLLSFTLAGAALGHHRLGTSLERRPETSAGIGLAAGLGFGVLVSFELKPGTAPTSLGSSTLAIEAVNAASFVASCLGIMTLLATSVVLSRIPRLAPALTRVGQRTLEVFLAHVIVVAAMRIALVRLGVENEWLLLVVLITVGVAVPLVLANRSRALGLEWLFDLPSAIKSRVDRPSARPAGTGLPYLG